MTPFMSAAEPDTGSIRLGQLDGVYLTFMYHARPCTSGGVRECVSW
jgi:hypothetical protein